MIRRLIKKTTINIIILTVAVMFASCGSTQNAAYFSDLDSIKVRALNSAEFSEPLIQTDDVLSITIQTLGQAVSSSLNQNGALPTADLNPGTVNMGGFLVDREGAVEMPMLGIVKISGLTTSQAKEVIREKAAKFYKEPTVQVRFSNYKITVLGEVAKPATYTVPNEKVSILDAISMAGDLTINGKRENVLLIRDTGDKKEIIRFNLNSSTTLTSPYFYLKQNDVLYVEPTKAKVAASNAPRTQLITVGVSVITLLITIISTIR